MLQVLEPQLQGLSLPTLQSDRSFFLACCELGDCNWGFLFWWWGLWFEIGWLLRPIASNALWPPFLHCIISCKRTGKPTPTSLPSNKSHCKWNFLSKQSVSVSQYISITIVECYNLKIYVSKNCCYFMFNNITLCKNIENALIFNRCWIIVQFLSLVHYSLILLHTDFMIRNLL